MLICTNFLCCVFFSPKTCLISCHNVLYISIKKKMAKIAWLIDLEKKYFFKTSENENCFNMDPKYSLNISGDHASFIIVFLFSFTSCVLGCFFIVIIGTQVLGLSIKAWFIHLMSTIRIKWVLTIWYGDKNDIKSKFQTKNFM